MKPKVRLLPLMIVLAACGGEEAAGRDGGAAASPDGGPPGDARVGPAPDARSPDAAAVDASSAEAGLADAAPADATPADAAHADAAPPPPDARVEPGCLPNPLTGTWTGDAHATADCGPYVFGRADITGDLVVDEGVAVRFDALTTVAGDLRVEPGARLLCVSGVPTNAGFLRVEGASAVRGTGEAPVVFARDEVGGANNGCLVDLGAADVDHARFASTPATFGPGSSVHDSVFDPSGNEGDRTWLNVSPGTVLEHDRFTRAQIRGRGFVARFNHFDGAGYETSIEICQRCGNGGDACTGTRAESAEVVVTDNVFDTDPGDSVFRLGRTFGETTLPNNYFSRGRPNRPDAWTGSPRGCADDELGAYGGPLRLTPVAANPPAVYGPRP